MIKSYFKIFFRTLLKQKGYSLINIMGLSVGIAASFLIFLWVRDEFSYEKFHLNREELHLVMQNQKFKDRTVMLPSTPPAIAYYLKKDYPEIVNATRVSPQTCPVKYENKQFDEPVFYVDPSFLEMFTFPLSRGNPRRFFPDISSALITEEVVQKYFGRGNPIGKFVTIKGDSFKISGVLKNIPRYSSLHFHFLIPIDSLEKQGINLSEYGVSDFLTLVQIHKGASYKDISGKISNFFQKYVSKDNIRELFLFPVSYWRLFSSVGGTMRIIYIGIFSLTAILILAIAWINFINLTTARTANRAREVGIRKVVGARRFKLVKQFFGESVLMVVCAMILAIAWTKLLLPLFNTLSKKPLTLDLFSTDILLAFIAIGIFTCFAAGWYPALFLSSSQPANILGMKKIQGKKGRSRKTLVFVQFLISVVLIISTTVVYKQLHYIKNRDLGLDKENIVTIPLDENIIKNYPAMKNEWLKNPPILNVTTSSNLPSNISPFTGGWDWEGETSTTALSMKFGLFGYDYTDTFRIAMVEGRFYSEDFSDTQAVVVNEKAVEAMGLKAPLGKRLSHRTFGQDFHIIGVVKNFNFMSLHYQIQPLILIKDSSKVNNILKYNYLFIRISPINIDETIKYVESTFKKFNPGYTFEYKFLDEDFYDLYQDEQHLGSLISYGAFLAIFISCLGLLGLSAFMVEQRIKEIAVRKVFGASAAGIVSLFSKEFVRLILMASILGGVIAYYTMTKWLQGFAQRTSFSWWIFLMAAALSLGIALLMISIQILRAVTRNPVDYLKYE